MLQHKLMPTIPPMCSKKMKTLHKCKTVVLNEFNPCSQGLRNANGRTTKKTLQQMDWRKPNYQYLKTYTYQIAHVEKIRKFRLAICTSILLCIGDNGSALWCDVTACAPPWPNHQYRMPYLKRKTQSSLGQRVEPWRISHLDTQVRDWLDPATQSEERVEAYLVRRWARGLTVLQLKSQRSESQIYWPLWWQKPTRWRLARYHR